MVGAAYSRKYRQTTLQDFQRQSRRAPSCSLLELEISGLRAILELSYEMIKFAGFGLLESDNYLTGAASPPARLSQSVLPSPMLTTRAKFCKLTGDDMLGLGWHLPIFHSFHLKDMATAARYVDVLFDKYLRCSADICTRYDLVPE